MYTDSTEHSSEVFMFTFVSCVPHIFHLFQFVVSCVLVKPLASTVPVQIR